MPAPQQKQYPGLSDNEIESIGAVIAGIRRERNQIAREREHMEHERANWNIERQGLHERIASLESLLGSAEQRLDDQAHLISEKDREIVTVMTLSDEIVQCAGRMEGEVHSIRARQLQKIPPSPREFIRRMDVDKDYTEPKLLMRTLGRLKDRYFPEVRTPQATPQDAELESAIAQNLGIDPKNPPRADDHPPHSDNLMARVVEDHEAADLPNFLRKGPASMEGRD